MIFGKLNNKNLDSFKLLFYYFKTLGLAAMTCDLTSTKNSTNHYWSFASSKNAIVYNVILIMVLAMSNVYSMTYFCSSNYQVDFDTIADCGKTTIYSFIVSFILVSSCISRNTLIIIANSISRITDSLLSLSSTNIQKNNQVSSDIKKILIINIIMWTGLFGIMVLDVMPWTQYAITIHVSSFIVNVLAIQYSVILKFLQYDFKILNENLIEFRNEELMKIRSTTETKTKVDRILQLQKLHELLSDISRDVSNFYSYPMLAYVLEVFISLMFACYYLTKPMILHNDLTTIMLIQCFWYGFAYAMLLVTLTKCVTATIEESKRTKEIISSCLIIPVDEKVLNKLNQFSIYLLHRDIKFTVFGLFSLDESLLTSMAGSIATYMVMVLQFQQNVRFPRCYFDQYPILHVTPCQSPILSTAPLLSRLGCDNNSSRVCCQRQLTIQRWRRGTSCCRSYGYRRDSVIDVEEEDSIGSGESSDCDCRPIVYERGELLIIEDTKDVVASRVDDNEAACAEDELLDSLCDTLPGSQRNIPSLDDRNFDSHTADGEKNCTNRPLNHASKRCSDETIFFDVDVLVAEKSSLSLRFCGEERKNEPEKIARAYGKLEKKINGAKRTNQLFEELNSSGSKCRTNDNIEVDESRKDAVTQCSHKKSKKSKNKQISRIDRPDRISTIDLHCSKFTIGYPDEKKTKKPKKCPATCRYFKESQKAASDDHQRVLSNRKKSKKRV